MVIQEIFGVNHHIRAVCDRLAAAVMSPLRRRSSTASNRTSSAAIRPTRSPTRASSSPIRTGRRCCSTPRPRSTRSRDVGPVGIVGFCLGGSVAYAAATKLTGLSAAVGYYGGAVVRFADDKPKVPTQLHFGEKDAGIPLTDVETIKTKRPDVEVYVYPGAQHGFHCDERASYDKASADIAWPRSLEFFAKHLNTT